MRVTPATERRISAISSETLWPGIWPPSPGFDPCAILISISRADIRYSAVTPKRPEATCLMALLPQSPAAGCQGAWLRSGRSSA